MAQQHSERGCIASRAMRRSPSCADDVARSPATGSGTNTHPGKYFSPRSAVDDDAVRRALFLLPEQFRVAIVLREDAQLGYAEIVAHQGVGVQTVKSRISRAHGQLVDLRSPALLGAE